MNQSPGPWSFARQLWTRNFRANPIGTVAGSVLAIGAVAFMLFFGFFVILALVVMGALVMLSQALFNPSKQQGPWVGESRDVRNEEFRNSRKKNEIEGEFEVVSDEKDHGSS